MTPMPYITRRRYDLRIAQARTSATAAERARLADKHAAEVDGLKLAIRDIEDARDKAEKAAAELTARLDALEARATRLLHAWKSAAGRASRERTLNDELIDELADHTPNVEIVTNIQTDDAQQIAEELAALERARGR